CTRGVARRFPLEGGPPMQRILPLLAVLCLGFTLALADEPKPDNRSDLEKMPGKWYRTRYVVAGEAQGEKAGEATIVIKGTHMQFPTPEDSWTITLDPTKDPKWFDYRGDIPFPNPRYLRSNTDIFFRGIYRLEGDTLTICSAYYGDEKDRPK